MNPPATSPILILGVPRSGTTLVRLILDAHPHIACGPETPWLAPHQPRSLGELCRFLVHSPRGYCRSFGMEPGVVTSAAAGFARELLGAYAAARGRRRFAEKTPDDALHLPFLLSLLPDAACVHMVRDGLDVAWSTCALPPHRRGIDPSRERLVPLGPGLSVPATPLSAVLRWRLWNGHIARALRGRSVHRVRYERLVARPRQAVGAMLEHLGEPFDERCLRPMDQPHDLPGWEWGSADARCFKGIDASRAGCARREMPALDVDLLGPMTAPRRAGRPEIEPRASLSSAAEVRSPAFTRFMEWLGELSRGLGLRPEPFWSKAWEYPWLWLHGLHGVDWRRARAVDVGSERSPMPWLLAMLGARITLVERDGRFVPMWRRLRRALRVRVDWRIVEDDRLPLPDASAHAVTSFSVLEHQRDAALAAGEMARVLAPGGIAAISFDVAVPGAGVPPSGAMTLERFGREVWSHPAFVSAPAPEWNMRDLPAFIEWHRGTDPRHDYAVAAAVMVRRGGRA